jgi:hypothetical protein
VRQAKPVEGGPDDVKDKSEKPSCGAWRRCIKPVRQRLTTSRKRVLRRRGRPRRRSVDSEHASRVIEPRKNRQSWRPTPSLERRPHRSTPRSWARRLHRGRRAGRVCGGTIGTWEISSPLMQSGTGHPRKETRGLCEWIA